MLGEISAYIEQNFGLVDAARCAGHAPPRAIEVLEKWRRAQKKREDFFSKPKRRAGLQRSDPHIDLALFDVAPHFATMLAHICPHNDFFLPSHLLSKSKAGAKPKPLLRAGGAATSCKWQAAQTLRQVRAHLHRPLLLF